MGESPQAVKLLVVLFNDGSSISSGSSWEYRVVFIFSSVDCNSSREYGRERKRAVFAAPLRTRREMRLGETTSWGRISILLLKSSLKKGLYGTCLRPGLRTFHRCHLHPLYRGVGRVPRRKTLNHIKRGRKQLHHTTRAFIWLRLECFLYRVQFSAKRKYLYLQLCISLECSL